MAQADYVFDDFLSDIEDEYKSFVSDINASLADGGYRTKIESKANGFMVSYSYPKTKRSILNFIFRKKKLQVRIYADNFGKYPAFMDALPGEMEKEIAKAAVCKRLINPTDCNSRCPMGYDFNIKTNRYQKCRYSCFQFEINEANAGVISEFIENERKERDVS